MIPASTRIAGPAGLAACLLLLSGAVPDSSGVPAGRGTPPLPGADSLAVGSEGLPLAPCTLPDVLPMDPVARDPVFGILLALIEQNRCGVISGPRLRRQVEASGRSTNLPVEYMQQLSRMPEAGSDGARAEVAVISTQDLNLPVPYRILTYEPGRMRASRRLVLEEWNLGTLRLDDPRSRGGHPVVLGDVRVWGIRSGRVEMDVDGWLDALMGSRLDDTRIVGFALFRYGNELLGMALGYNRDGQGRSGAFSFKNDKILFPSPLPMKIAGSHLRARLERLMPSVTARRHG